MANPKDANSPSGPAKVKNFTVTVNRDLCIGAATCVAIAPAVFTLDSDAKAIILDSSDSVSDDALLDAARGCPTAAIIVKDEGGNQVAP